MVAEMLPKTIANVLILVQTGVILYKAFWNITAISSEPVDLIESGILESMKWPYFHPLTPLIINIVSRVILCAYWVFENSRNIFFPLFLHVVCV